MNSRKNNFGQGCFWTAPNMKRHIYENALFLISSVLLNAFPLKSPEKKKKKPFACFFCETSFYEACAIQNVLNLLPIGLLAKIFSSNIYVLTFVMITLILLYESLRSKDGNNRCWKLCLNWTENNQWTLLKRSMLLINNLPAYLSHYGS